MHLENEINKLTPMIEIRHIGMLDMQFSTVRVVKYKKLDYRKETYFISYLYNNGRYGQSQNHTLWHMLTGKECRAIKEKIEAIDFSKLKDNYTSEDLGIHVDDGGGFDFIINYKNIQRNICESNYIGFINFDSDCNFKNFVLLVKYLQNISKKKDSRIVVTDNSGLFHA